MNENIADEIRKTIESIKDMKIQVSGINNYLSILEGMMRADIQKKVDEAYQRGVEDGRNETWDATRKIFGSNKDGGYCMEQIREILGKRSLFCTTDVIRQCAINEVIEKLKAYEEKQKTDEDVKRGDVVRSKVNGLTYIVTLASEGGYVLLDSDGNFGTSCITNSFEKTGKHVDIDKILEEMKE